MRLRFAAIDDMHDKIAKSKLHAEGGGLAYSSVNQIMWEVFYTDFAPCSAPYVRDTKERPSGLHTGICPVRYLQNNMRYNHN